MDENKTNQGIESFRKNLIEVEGLRDKYKDAQKPPKPEEFAKELAEIYQGRWIYSSKKRTFLIYEMDGRPTKEYTKASKDLMSHAILLEMESRGINSYFNVNFLNRVVRTLKKELQDVFA